MKTSKSGLSGGTGLSSTTLASMVPIAVIPASQAGGPQMWRSLQDSAKRDHDKRTKLIAGWIHDQLARDAAAANAGMSVLDVTHSQTRYNVRTLQWHQHGVSGPVTHEMRIPVDGDDESGTRKAVTQRFSRLVARQAELTRTFGPVRTVEAQDVDLSMLTIEKPLLEAMKTIHGADAEQAVRRIVVRSGIFIDYRQNEEATRAGFTSFAADMNRKCLSGAFTVPGTKGTVRWSRGSIAVLDGAAYPDSLLLSLRGRPLRGILEHPLFDPEMVVTGVNAMRRDGIDGISITVKGFTVPMPREWSHS